MGGRGRAGARGPGLGAPAASDRPGGPPLHPYPYVDALETVQQWPEAAEGAAAYEMWRDEEFDTGGLHPALPPEGLHYVLEPLREDPGIGLYEELIRLLTRRPEAAPGVLVDPASAERDVLGVTTGCTTPRASGS